MTFRVRAYPARRQHGLLADYLEHTRQLYNAALAERIDCYRKTRRTITEAEQSRELTILRADRDYARYPRRLQRWAINLVETAYRGMFTRYREAVKKAKEMAKLGKKVEKPRLTPPGFRARLFWSTIGWDSPVVFTMRERGLYNRKSFGGTLRLRPDRPLPDFKTCTALTLHRDGERWFAHLTYEVEDVALKAAPRRPVGIDIGLKTLAMRSDGIPMNVPRVSPEDAEEHRRAARALSRCKKRSRRRSRVRARLRRVNARIANRRKAALHLISARLVHHFDAVAVEDLNLAALNRSGGGGAQGRGVRKSWYDRAPGALNEMLKWKCERDGRLMRRVDPRGTTIECHSCGARVLKTLRERMHRCECGTVKDRDENAALNILARAGWGPGDANSDGRGAAVAAPGAELSLKHGDLVAGPRRGRSFARPPPSSSRGRTPAAKNAV